MAAISKNSHEASDNIYERRPWRTGFCRRIPLAPLSALLVAIICGFGTVVVLKISDGRAIDDWTVQGYNVQPTVVLSILVTAANALFRYAFVEGASTAWWVRAQRGTTLQTLHSFWKPIQSVFPLFTSGRHMTTTAVASFCVLLLLLDGPLLQRASSVVIAPQQASENLTIPVSPQPFVEGLTGYFGNLNDDPEVRYYTSLFLDVLQNYNSRSPIELPDGGKCNGQCDFDIIAAGWDIECHHHTTPYRLISPAENAEYYAKGGEDPFLTSSGPLKNASRYYGPDPSQVMFSVHVSRESFTMSLSSVTKSTAGGNGTLLSRHCVLQEAVQRYPVTVTNSTLAMSPTTVSENLTVYQFFRYDNEDQGLPLAPSTVGGLAKALCLQFSGSAKLGLTYINDTGLMPKGSSPLLYISSPKNASFGSSDHNFYNSYNITWVDPMDDMIRMVQELSLRLAIASSQQGSALASIEENEDFAATLPDGTVKHFDGGSIVWANYTTVDRTLSQVVTAKRRYDATLYQSNFAWLSGALVAILLAFAAILATFYGFWHLGRSAGMSPLEIAKAFEAPMLHYADPNGEIKEIVAKVGDRKVRYGAVSDGSSGSDPLLLPSSQVASPDLDEREPVEKSLVNRRLQFARQGIVEKPHEGATF